MQFKDAILVFALVAMIAVIGSYAVRPFEMDGRKLNCAGHTRIYFEPRDGDDDHPETDCYLACRRHNMDLINGAYDVQFGLQCCCTTYLRSRKTW